MNKKKEQKIQEGGVEVPPPRSSTTLTRRRRRGRGRLQLRRLPSASTLMLPIAQIWESGNVSRTSRSQEPHGLC